MVIVHHKLGYHCIMSEHTGWLGHQMGKVVLEVVPHGVAEELLHMRKMWIMQVLGT